MADARLANPMFRDSLTRYVGGTSTFTRFHRKQSRSQGLQDDLSQIASGMLWGQVPRGGKCPTAQAYFGPLPRGEAGIEFVTPVKPQQVGLPAGFGTNW